MQSLRSIGVLTLFFSLSLFILSCGGNAAHDHEHDSATETATEAPATEAAAHGEGKEYTSAYVCPMHCQGSGSDQAGSCPVCGMAYVAQAEHTADGHKH